jgi:hypothetical protein
MSLKLSTRLAIIGTLIQLIHILYYVICEFNYIEYNIEFAKWLDLARVFSVIFLLIFFVILSNKQK